MRNTVSQGRRLKLRKNHAQSFIVMLGGRHARANTEVHDVVLAVGDSLEDVYPTIKTGMVWGAKRAAY